MEAARKVLEELETLKRQVLENYPEAAAFGSAALDESGLPGQVQEEATAESAPATRRAPATAGMNSAVVEAVQKELSQRVNTLQSQVWRQLVREELESMAKLDQANGGNKLLHMQSEGHRNHSHQGNPHTPSQPNGHHLHPHSIVYTAEHVLGAVDGRTHRSSQKTPRESAGMETGVPGGHSTGSKVDEAKTASDGGDTEKEHEDKLDEENDPDAQWVSVSENAYGAFIHVGLQSGLWQAWRKCWTMLIVSIVIAVVFSGELIQRHQFFGDRISDKTSDFWVRERIHICWIPVKLQVAACMIFITLIFNNVPGMVEAGRIVLQSTHHKFGDGDDVGEMQKTEEDAAGAKPLKVSSSTRLGIFACAVLTEVATWFMILAAGILFIFTSTTVDLVIRSTVAVMFVLNVDEIVFASVRAFASAVVCY